MANNENQLTFYEEYVKLKHDSLLSAMDYLITKMQSERCNVRHYKQWEAEMTSFKEEYRIFRKNILQWLNDGETMGLEDMAGPCCEELEDRYEILVQIFLEKRDEIRNKTTYFETKQTTKSHSSFLVLPFKHFDIHILALKLRRKP